MVYFLVYSSNSNWMNLIPRIKQWALPHDSPVMEVIYFLHVTKDHIKFSCDACWEIWLGCLLHGLHIALQTKWNVMVNCNTILQNIEFSPLEVNIHQACHSPRICSLLPKMVEFFLTSIHILRSLTYVRSVCSSSAMMNSFRRADLRFSSVSSFVVCWSFSSKDGSLWRSSSFDDSELSCNMQTGGT